MTTGAWAEQTRAEQRENLRYSAATFLLTVPVTTLRGFVLAQVWAWFVVPVLHLPPLTLVQALGLALVASAFCPPRWPPEEQRDEPIRTLFWRAIKIGVGVPLTTLAYAWVLARFM